MEEVVVNDVASLNVYVNGEDSSSNWLMMVVLLEGFVWKDHRYFHDDGRVHDDVDNEMY